MIDHVRYTKASPGDEIPGTWMPIPEDNEFKRRRGEKAEICCRKCGNVTAIRTHRVSTDGTVTPSLVCPINSCDEHVFGVFENWTPPEQK